MANTKDSLDRLEIKVDRVLERVGAIDVTLGAQHVSLVDHIRRTALLENQMEPIKTHVTRVQGALKLIAWAIGLVAGAGIIEWISK